MRFLKFLNEKQIDHRKIVEDELSKKQIEMIFDNCNYYTYMMKNLPKVLSTNDIKSDKMFINTKMKNNKHLIIDRFAKDKQNVYYDLLKELTGIYLPESLSVENKTTNNYLVFPIGKFDFVSYKVSILNDIMNALMKDDNNELKRLIKENFKKDKTSFRIAAKNGADYQILIQAKDYYLVKNISSLDTHLAKVFFK